MVVSVSEIRITAVAQDQGLYEVSLVGRVAPHNLIPHEGTEVRITARLHQQYVTGQPLQAITDRVFEAVGEALLRAAGKQVPANATRMSVP